MEYKLIQSFVFELAQKHMTDTSRKHLANNLFSERYDSFQS